jgi:GNAT superfamily N-acetyltransferase
VCQEIVIRRADVKDTDSLVEFNLAMAQETEGKDLPPRVVTAGVRSLLASSDKGFYLVAECRGQAVGALMVTSEWSDWRDGYFLWLQSVYVRPAWRRRGVFRRLFENLTSLAEERADVCGLRLYVEQSNTVAQSTYAALGMAACNYRVFEMEL